jgi:endonuclease YncB( thermonuclease family)
VRGRACHEPILPRVRETDRVRVPGSVKVLIAVVVIGVIAWLSLQLSRGDSSPAAPPDQVPVDAPVEAPAAATEATVEYVHDGDTLFLDDGTKVRLLGIDTPEIGDNAECYGDEATAQLRQLLPEGSRVRVLADVEPFDQYGRSLLFLYTADGVLVNLALIDAGAAEAVVLPPNVLFADELEAAEDRAQAAGLGMWGSC